MADKLPDTHVTLPVDLAAHDEMFASFTGEVYALFRKYDLDTPKALSALAFATAYTMQDRVGRDQAAFKFNLENFGRMVIMIFHGIEVPPNETKPH